MESIKSLYSLPDRLAAMGRRTNVVVVRPRDRSTVEAVDRAVATGFVHPVIVDDEDPAKAAEKAVETVLCGEAEVLMKGLITSDVLLRAILNRDHGLLLPGEVLTHIGVADIPGHSKLLFYTDAAVIPYPTQEQRIRQVAYIARLCRSMGTACPRISLIHCSEKIDGRHFPFTLGYGDIIRLAEQGLFGECIVDGPLDLKTSCSIHSMQVKGIQSPIAGEADALVFPDIEGGNLFHKTITLFAAANTAGILQGTRCPVVMPSRSDSADSKFYSLALAAMSTL